MTVPSFLQTGDTVGIIAPAYHVLAEQWEPAVALIQSWGLQVTLGKSLYLHDRRFAGNDLQRLDDLTEMMSRPDVKAVICARGGYGTARLLPALDHNVWKRPKWLIGYSDITVLLTYCSQQLQQQCIHGTMPIDLIATADDAQLASWEYLRQILFGQLPCYTVPANACNRQGEVTAPLIGGNLSVLYSLNGSSYQCRTEGRILFIEDVGESLYHLDRMMNSFRISGQLAALSGLLVGSMSDMKDSNPSFGKTACEIIREHVDEYGFPVAFDFPAGHGGINYPLVIGASMKLNVTADSVFVCQILY